LVNEIEVAPVEAVKTRGGAAPQPVIAGAVELLTVTPTGRLSVSEKFVRFVSLGATTSILNLELLPGVIEAGENDFVPVTSVPRTVTLAFAERKLVTPWLVVRAPAGIVLVNPPDGVPAGAVT
jgi:hypothetical protein